MDHDVGGFFEHFRGIGDNRNAPRRVGSAHDVAEIAARFFRIGIDRTDDFDGLLLPHQPDNRRSDGADAVLHRSNFLFHDGLRRAVSRNRRRRGRRFVQIGIWRKQHKAISMRVQPDSASGQLV